MPLFEINSMLFIVVKKLYRKFDVRKTDGTPVDPHAQYFVLRIDTDHAARVALLAYADVVEQSEPEFASQLRLWATVYSPDYSTA